jgi:hypothetical protein
MQIALNLSQSGERPRQFARKSCRTGDGDRLNQIPLCLLKPMFSSRLTSLL